MALAFIGAVVLVPDRILMGRHMSHMPPAAPRGLDTHKALVGTAVSSERARPEEPAAAVRLQPEASSACQRCKGRCSLFSSSPVCCTAQCSRACPTLLAGFGCSVSAAPHIVPLALECEQCEQACIDGVTCCARRICRLTCERTRPTCARAGYIDEAGDAEGGGDGGGGRAGAMGLGVASPSDGAGRRRSEGDEGGRAPGAVSSGTRNLALRAGATASLAELEGSAAICAACDESVRIVGPRHGCTATCVSRCPRLARAHGCAPESADQVCYQCRAACSLLGTASLQTKLMCCRDECISACPATMASYACPGVQLDTAAQLARRFGVAPSVFADGATAAFCEGCLSACSESAVSDGCCSPLCVERCAAASRSPQHPVPSCGRLAAEPLVQAELEEPPDKEAVSPSTLTAGARLERAHTGL